MNLLVPGYLMQTTIMIATADGQAGRFSETEVRPMGRVHTE